jgi:lipid A 4'-phosphatase
MWILLFLFFAPFTPTVDLYISGLFYTPGQGFYDNLFFHYLFKYGELFGLATGGLASLAFLLTSLKPKWKKYRRGFLAMILTLALGAGLITNMGLKQYWGRPRPKQVIEFGGKHLYRPFWRPDFNTRHDPQKSFPSGHVAMGFYFLSCCLMGRRYKSNALFWSALFLTLFLGGGLMVGRVAQGGHFVSDVIASLLIMWYVARTVDKCLFTWGGSLQRALCVKQRGTSQAPDDA